jgi:hypothetical protein
MFYISFNFDTSCSILPSSFYFTLLVTATKVIHACRYSGSKKIIYVNPPPIAAVIADSDPAFLISSRRKSSHRPSFNPFTTYTSVSSSELYPFHSWSKDTISLRSLPALVTSINLRTRCETLNCGEYHFRYIAPSYELACARLTP